MAGLPQIVRLADTEEAWTVDLRTMVSNIEEISAFSQGIESQIGYPCNFPSLPVSAVH